MFYEMSIAGLKRKLPLCRINDDLYIAAFIMFGDVEITRVCAAELLKKVPKFDIVLTAESKGIPLAYEFSRQAGKNEYVVARKSVKLYMENVISTKVDSITTAQTQTLFLGSREVRMIRGRKVLILDDVISTGKSLFAMEDLVRQAGGKIAGRAAVLAEGEAAVRDDIIFLAPLPLFNSDGTEKQNN